MNPQEDAAGPVPRRSTWRVFLSYARPHWAMLLVGGVLSLATAASALALPLVVRELIGNLGTDAPVVGLVALMSVLVVANAAIGALGGYVLRRTAESVVLEARRGLLARLLRLKLSAVERHEPGDLMSRVTADTTLLRDVTIGTLVGGVTGVLTLVATEAWGASVRAAAWGAIAGNTAGLSIQVAFIAVLVVGGARVTSGSITIGTLVAFLLYVFFLMSPVSQLAGAVIEYHVGAAAVTRILEAQALPVEPAASAADLPQAGSPPAS